MIKALAIGASAGGVEALSRLLPNLQRAEGTSVFVVQHARNGSYLSFVQLLNRLCALDVKVAQDKCPIEKNHIYIAPPDYHMQVSASFCFSVNKLAKVNYSRPSIDVLFQSVAEAYRSSACGLILTGANNDGAQGLKKIKEHGGLAIVQSPLDASFPEMPKSALLAVRPNAVLSLKRLCELFKNVGKLEDSISAYLINNPD
ncbi:MAG: chemotaxis protein CheB [Bacteroidales bacterium]|nr:chemotaxis protein CheB [Bacteroidales bacterium]